MTSVAVVRHEWEDGSRRLESAADDPARYAQLLQLLELVVDELRKRVGQTYTLGDLAVAYGDAEGWARELLDDRALLPSWPRELTTVLAAAFDAYQRGAADYVP